MTVFPESRTMRHFGCTQWVSRDKRALRAVFALILAFGFSGAVKFRYRDAGPEELRWLLVPTAKLVEVMSGAKFEPESRRGYLCRERHFEIVPACAGLNFLLIVHLSSMLGCVGADGSWRLWAARWTASLAMAYPVTIGANAARIAVAMWMHGTALCIGPLTPHRLHEIEGVLVFFVSLCGSFLVVQRTLGGHRASTD